MRLSLVCGFYGWLLLTIFIQAARALQFDELSDLSPGDFLIAKWEPSTEQPVKVSLICHGMGERQMGTVSPVKFVLPTGIEDTGPLPVSCRVQAELRGVGNFALSNDFQIKQKEFTSVGEPYIPATTTSASATPASPPQNSSYPTINSPGSSEITASPISESLSSPYPNGAGFVAESTSPSAASLTPTSITNNPPVNSSVTSISMASTVPPTAISLPPEQTNGSLKKTSIGPILGGVVGAVLFLVLAAIIVIFRRRRRKLNISKPFKPAWSKSRTPFSMSLLSKKLSEKDEWALLSESAMAEAARQTEEIRKRVMSERRPLTPSEDRTDAGSDRYSGESRVALYDRHRSHSISGTGIRDQVYVRPEGRHRGAYSSLSNPSSSPRTRGILDTTHMDPEEKERKRTEVFGLMQRILDGDEGSFYDSI